MTGIVVDTNDMIELREVIIRTMKGLDIYICIDDQHYNYFKRPKRKGIYESINFGRFYFELPEKISNRSIVKVLGMVEEIDYKKIIQGMKKAFDNKFWSGIDDTQLTILKDMINNPKEYFL